MIRWFRDLRLGWKVLAGFGLIAAIVVAQSLLAFRALQEDGRARDWVQHTFEVISTANRAQASVLSMQLGYRGFVLVGQDEYLEPYNAGLVSYQTSIADLKALTGDNSDQLERWNEIEQVVTNWQRDVAEPGVALRRSVDAGTATADELFAFVSSGAGQQAIEDVRGRFDEAIGVERALLDERSARIDEQGRTMQTILVGGTAAIIVIGLAVTGLLVRSIGTAATAIATTATQLADGDLRQRVQLDRRDELGQTAIAFNRMADRLSSNVQKLEEALQNSSANETRVLTIMNSAGEGIMTVDERAVIVLANPASGRIFGTAPAALIGRSVGKVMPGFDDFLRTAAREHNAINMPHVEVTGYRGDDSTFPAELTISETSVDGQRQFIIVTRDVSRWKQAEIVLRRQFQSASRSRGEARAILDAVNDIIVLIGADHRVKTVNRRFGEAFGVSPDEVINHRLEDLESLVDRAFGVTERFSHLIVAALDDPEQEFVENLTQRWPQERQLLLYSAPVHGLEDEHLGRLYVFRDVTHEREVDRMKTEFVSLVSHELRTPMTSIKGYVDLLLDGDAGEITDEQREFLTIVGNNAQRLVALINDILDISRIEAGAIDLQRGSHSMTQLVSGVVATLRPQIVAKQQRLTLDLPDDPLLIWGDSDRVTQIITNLLSNAHKYTPVRGEITVRAWRDAQVVRVEVSDTGVGLAADEQKQLFTKFYRARNRATQGVGGTGLGLSITRNLVELHGGEITVRSAPGEGSTFGFSIPIAEQALSEVRENPALSQGGTILVVEDEPDIANLIRHYLERAGYAVIAAGTAAEALDIAMTKRPNLITLDILLPDSDGFDVLEKLHADERTAAIPVIMLSILADGQGAMLGAVDYLTKPVDERLLLEQVHRRLAADHPRQVLVAEDEEDTRALIVAGLRKAGHQVIEAANGAEAAMLCAEHLPDLALLDVRMPGTDGIEALSALRTDPATRDIPVVMMTASPDLSSANRSYIEALGATLISQKPISAQDLAEVIDREWAKIGAQRSTSAVAIQPGEGQR